MKDLIVNILFITASLLIFGEVIFFSKDVILNLFKKNKILKNLIKSIIGFILYFIPASIGLLVIFLSFLGIVEFCTYYKIENFDSVFLLFLFFCIFILFILYVIFHKFLHRYFCAIGYEYERYKKYIEKNKTKIGLFVRPAINNYITTIANKQIAITFDLLLLDTKFWQFKILNKLTREEIIITSKGTLFDDFFKGRYYVFKSPVALFFQHICDVFDYDTTAEDVFREIKYCKVEYNKKISKLKNLYLDINQSSEAELTAIPGVTIAKAKHAVKIRKKKIKFLTMNQFYKTIDLEEDFIDKISTEGNKISLDNLPEYNKIEEKDSQE